MPNDPQTTKPSSDLPYGLSVRSLILTGKLRSMFGSIFRGEPTIRFRPDGTVRVMIGECYAEISKDIADRMFEERTNARI